MTLWHENLHRIIARIDALMPSDEPSNGLIMNYDELRAFQANVRRVIDLLVAAEGGRFSSQGDTLRLRLAGVQSTCTQGPSGLLRNWQTAARRKLEEAADEAAKLRKRIDRLSDSDYRVASAELRAIESEKRMSKPPSVTD